MWCEWNGRLVLQGIDVVEFCLVPGSGQCQKCGDSDTSFHRNRINPTALDRIKKKCFKNSVNPRNRVNICTSCVQSKEQPTAPVYEAWPTVGLNSYHLITECSLNQL